MDMSSYFSGRVHSVIFENEAKAFYILRVSLDQEAKDPGAPSSTVTVRGDIPGIKMAVGTWFGFEGVWDNHPQHGRQIKVTKAPVIKSDWGPDTIAKILQSHGVGGGVVASLHAHFGDKLVEALADPSRLIEVPSITSFMADHISHKWKSARAHFLTLDFLNDLGLPQGRVRQVWAVFGDTAKDVLSVDPWALVQIEGITFEDADTVAVRLNLDCSHNNPKRVEGAVLYASRSGRGFGHMYSSTQDILRVVHDIDPMIGDRDILFSLKALTDRKLLVLDRVTSPGLTAIYDPWSYKMEVESAVMLRARQVGAIIGPDTAQRYIKSLLVDPPAGVTLREAVQATLTRIGSTGGVTLSEKQSEGVVNALTEPVSIITGLPGTGKSTSLRMAVLLLQEAGVNLLQIAPTGIAAKRMSSLTGAPASTIHRAFGAKGSSDEGREATYAGVVGDSEVGPVADGSDEVWGFQGSPHPAEVVILDESSMMDQHLLYRVLACTRPECRLVFVGDAAQLPSVGPGNVLRDLIATRLYPTVSLTEIFRQADTSPIIRAAHDIHKGKVPDAPEGSDFTLLQRASETEVADVLVTLATKLFESRQNFQMLSPRHSGPVGVTTLNTRLREILNPRQPSLQEVKLGTEVLREDDRIMVVKNDYKLGIYNGDVGKVAGIDKKNKEIEIKIHGPPVLHVKVPFKVAHQLLRLAYAVTVHKMQGQEADVILMPLVTSFRHQLQRNLFYTAVTRARKKVVLVGHWEAMSRAVDNDREGARNTLFLNRLLPPAPKTP